MSYKITVSDDCIGCGACVGVCPDNFELIDGKSKAKNATVEEIGCCGEAKDACPVDAISVEEN